MEKKVWFVTGASRGLGLALVKVLLSNGYSVASTSRDLESLKSAVGPHRDSFLPLEVDLTNEDSVKKAATSAVAYFGKIDIVVNNAGYGQIGALEELSDAEARASYEINVFGLVNVVRYTMPYLRAQGSGHIMNISSIGGFYGGYAGWAIYCSSKFAVVGLTEALAAEVKEFNVKATVVLPGGFRTDFLSKDSLRTPLHPIEEYKEARRSQQFFQQEVHRNQPGDPEKAAHALIQIAGHENPPLHLFLGNDAYEAAIGKIETMENEMSKWRTVSVSTGF